MQETLKMQVSKEKSTVVVSKPSFAPAVADRVVGKTAKAASHAKVLGTDLVGGVRRCTYQLRAHVAIHGEGCSLRRP